MPQTFPPLTIVEDFLLLALDEQAGDFYPLPRSVLDCVTAAAVLMDLMRLKRVDCDLRHLFVVTTEPTGDAILDPVLRALALEPVQSTRAILDELRFLSDEGEALRDQAMQRLVDRGILRAEEKKFLWLFDARRYPVVDGKEIRIARLRVMNAVLDDGIPDPYDGALIALLQACGLFHYLLKPTELERSAGRIAEIARTDILGRAAATLIAEIEASIAMASGLR